MALPSENVSMALYCDFENVALGVRDSKYNKIDIKPVLERLLLKGSIVVKKAYCDWERYKEFKAQMHEASFELIEIPHVRQSGKNSADIRLVVDALDLCYTKSHVNTFVIISGDSDFSPLVSKLRENAKFVIGVGVKDSTSDLLIANCDEFIFIDDLLRENRRAAAKRTVRQTAPAARPSTEEEQSRKEDLETRKSTAIDIALETFDALLVERGDTGKIWASTLKQAIKRRKPDFSETYFGFKTFSNLLEEAQSRGLIEIGRDERSGAYVSRSGATRQENGSAMPVVPQNSMRREQAVATASAAIAEESTQLKPVEPPEAATESANANRNVESARRGSGRKSAARKRSTPAVQDAGAAEAGVAELPIKPEENATGAVAKKTAAKRKTAARNSRRTSNNETPAQDAASPPEKNGGD